MFEKHTSLDVVHFDVNVDHIRRHLVAMGFRHHSSLFKEK